MGQSRLPAMAKSLKSAGVLRFGVFEVDLRAGELRKDGLKVRLQEQPFRVLALLLEKPGEVVTRDELREKLWSADTYVDFDKSLNTTVNKLREALRDSAENPRFVQTLHRRGYRFIAPVEGIAQESPAVRRTDLAQSGTRAGVLPARPGHLLGSQRFLQIGWAVTSVLLVAALGVVLAMWLRGPDTQAPLRRFAFTPPEGVDATAYRINVAISPNGKHIAFITAGSEGKLWVQDLDQRQPRAIDGTEGAYDPFWSPDSDFIGFAAGGELKKVSVQGGLAIRLCELPGTGLDGGTWSPDGEVIVFSSGPQGCSTKFPPAGGLPTC